MAQSSTTTTGLDKLFNNIIRSRNNEKRKVKCLDELISRLDSSVDGDDAQQNVEISRRVVDKICSSTDVVAARLEALKLADILFTKYAGCRQFIVNHLHNIIATTVDPTCKILPGIRVKGDLSEFRNASLKTILKWHASFGGSYPKLKLVLRFLEQNKSVDMERKQVLTIVEQKQMNTERDRQNLVITKISELYEADYPDMQNCIKIIENGSNLIFPQIPNVDINNTASIVEENCLSNEQPTCSKTLNIELNPQTTVEKTSDNKDLLTVIGENYAILKRKFIRKLNFWLQYMKRHNVDPSNEMFLKISALRQKISIAIEKYEELRIVEKNWSSGDESDLEFIMVNERKILGSLTDDLLSNKLNDIDSSYKNSDQTRTMDSGLSNIFTRDASPIDDKVRDWKDIAFEDDTIISRIKREKGIDLTDDGKRKSTKKTVKPGTSKSRIMKKMKVKMNQAAISRLKKF